MYMIDRMMSLAGYSWSNEEYEESLVLAVMGIAAASKLHHPKMHDRQAFESYVKAKLTEIISRYLFDRWIPYPIVQCTINRQGLEQILYKTLRCSLVHELVFPDNVRLADPRTMREPFEVDDNGTITFSNRLPLALSYTVLHDPLVHAIRIRQVHGPEKTPES